MAIKELSWFGLYKESWGNDLVPAAFSHPAKVQPALSKKIIEHLLEQGYIEPGAVAVDPFGGIAGFALACMMNGLHYVGCELEPRFVQLGNENIALWQKRYAPHFPNFGTARLLQGDSRELVKVLGNVGCVISSPPYSETLQNHGVERARKLEGSNNGMGDYGRTPGQLGNMPEGSYTAVISSPPFSPPGNQPTGRGQGVREDYRNGKTVEADPLSDYGGSNGQLGSMPMTDFDAVISSPAYGDSVNGVGEGPGARFDPIYHNGENATKKSNANGYGVTDGQLGRMAVGAVLSSPPYAGIAQTDSQQRGSPDLSRKNSKTGDRYGEAPGNIGNEQSGTFWTSAKTIVAQCYQTLRPGGVAVWVCGDYVRDGKRVYFGKQWLTLCESVGFEPLEWVTAWKREPGPVQAGIFEDRDMTVDRVSFFRRLANNRAIENGNEEAAILNEDVIIVRKPASQVTP